MRTSNLVCCTAGVLAGPLLVGLSAVEPAMAAAGDVTTPLVHYTFDEDPAGTVVDRSGHGHDAAAVDTQYVAELDGRRGVLRFNGDSSRLELGHPETLEFAGDMTIEMWVRRNGPVKGSWGILFGEYPPRSFYLVEGFHHTLMMYGRSLDGSELMLMPTDPDIIDGQWAHIAVVVEYPRCRFYRDGLLVRDVYMPLEGPGKLNNQPKFIGGSKEGHGFPMDLDEFRWHRRALSAEEIAAHARGEVTSSPAHELAADTHWYDRTVTLRLNSRNGAYQSHQAEFTLRSTDGATVFIERVPLVEGPNHPGRYIATVTRSIEGLEGGNYDAVVRVIDADQREVAKATQEVSFAKPEWVDSRAGYSDEVPGPWTPIEARQHEDAVELGVWGRRYRLTDNALVEQIMALDDELLAAPMTLHATVSGKSVAWRPVQPKLTDTTKRAASVEQTMRSDDVALTVRSVTEFDGYVIFDCRLQADRDVTLDGLTLDIPLRSEYARLCYGDRIRPPKKGIAISEWYSGTVGGDIAFHFGPTVWLGSHDRGLLWQAESDEHWRNADRERAIEILPRGDRTTLRAHFVDTPTRLKRGETLEYKFAVQATPIRPMGRSAWDLRIMRSGPYGNELHLPDRQIGGRPALQYLSDLGVRHFWYSLVDQWPHPTPAAPEFIGALQRLIDATHASGMKVYPYLLHQRYPVVVPEYDIHGLHMARRPQRTYLQGYTPVDSPVGRPGPLPLVWGAGAQGAIFACPKSQALQDSYVHALAERLDRFHEDGVYLDGTVHIPPCENGLHGCGYRDQTGKVRGTFPVFAVREYLQRIYQVVKQDDPQKVVDIHCSWGYNPAALAYGDVMWTGEQWHHLRHGGAEHVPDELTLDMFQTEFLGHQIGIAAEALSYRLGSTMKTAAVSLLHDVPVRLNSGGRDPAYLTGMSEESEKNAPSGTSGDEEQIYLQRIANLWRVRDEFGADDAKKLFYWENAEHIQLSPERCHALLFVHPSNGVLVFVTNLSREAHEVRVQLELRKLGLTAETLEAMDVLSNRTVAIDAAGNFVVPLGAVEWTYIWVRPYSRE